MPATTSATLYTDPACPWGYSAIPALRVLEWRYGSQIDWRLAMIGLTESAEQYLSRGFTPLLAAKIQPAFRRYGMPFATEPKARATATARACRAVVAARLTEPGSEWAALRALQIAGFTTSLILEDDVPVSAVVSSATGIPAATILGMLDGPDVGEAYERDRAESRSAAGTPVELQGKTATTDDGQVRYTAPSVIFERGDARLYAGGMQPVEAYDVVIANLDPTLERRPAPDDAGDLFDAFPEGLTTQEVAAMLAKSNDAPDRDAAEQRLLDLIGDGRIVRVGLGDGAIWAAPEHGERWRDILAAASGARRLETIGA
jgi:protein-disulfide isomerase-like protein with CxxC motif